MASRRKPAADAGKHLWVGLGGLEPPTSSLSGKRSNRLSYRPFTYAPDLREPPDSPEGSRLHRALALHNLPLGRTAQGSAPG